jgi:hypothetical protein
MRRSTQVLQQTWHIEQNPNCNGGLKNAVDSMQNELKKRLWVGTLGTNTDRFTAGELSMQYGSLNPAEFESRLGPLAVSSLCHPRRAQNEAFL